MGLGGCPKTKLPDYNNLVKEQLDYLEYHPAGPRAPSCARALPRPPPLSQDWEVDRLIDVL